MKRESIQKINLNKQVLLQDQFLKSKPFNRYVSTDLMNARAASALLLICIASLILLPAASADPGIGDWQHNVDLEAGQSAEYTWTIYNPDDTSYALDVVSTVSGNDSHITTAVNGNPHQILKSKDSADITVTLHTDRATPTQTATLSVSFILTDMASGSETIIDKDVVVNITSLISSTGNNILIWENNLPAPFNTAIWTFIFTILIWIGISAAIIIIVDPILKYVFGKSKLQVISKIYKLVKKPLFLTLIAYALVNSLTILSVSMDTIFKINDILTVLFIIFYAWVSYRVYNDVIIDFARKLASKTENELDDALVPFMHTLGSILIPLVAFVIILNYFNMSFTAILAGLGIGSIVIGLAAQDTFNSIFAGIQIMIDRPFTVGDRIILSTGEVCDVEKIGIRSTRAYSPVNNEMVVIPNVLLCSNKVTNMSRPDGHRAISVEVGVSYGTDPEKVEKILIDIAKHHPDVVNNNPAQAPYTRLSAFDDSAITFALWAYVDNFTKEGRVRSELRESINQKFNEEGIEIPFPQTVVTFANSPVQSKNDKQSDLNSL